MKKMYFMLFIMGLFVMSSCGGEKEEVDRAEELCSCVEDSEVDFNLQSLENLHELQNILKDVKRSERSDVAKCFTKVLRDMKSDLKGENNEEKVEYLKKFSESYNDSDCGEINDLKDVDPDKFDKMLNYVIREMESNIDIGDRAYDDY